MTGTLNLDCRAVTSHRGLTHGCPLSLFKKSLNLHWQWDIFIVLRITIQPLLESKQLRDQIHLIRQNHSNPALTNSYNSSIQETVTMYFSNGPTYAVL